MLRKKAFILFFIILLLYSCTAVPITGRKQFSFISNGQLLYLSKTNFQQILDESQLSQDSAKVDLVESVGNKIARAAEQFLRENNMVDRIKNYQWEFKLMEDKQNVNAFCLPGGKIGIYTGILEVAEDEQGLATVLAHEVAHAIANHAGERLSQLLLVELGETTLSEALRKNPDKTNQIWLLAYGLATNLGIILPYSRIQESEADHIGLILMAKAGYDPRAAIYFWQRMEKRAKSQPLEFLSTHPASAKRLENIRNLISEAMAYYKDRK